MEPLISVPAQQDTLVLIARKHRVLQRLASTVVPVQLTVVLISVLVQRDTLGRTVKRLRVPVILV